MIRALVIGSICVWTVTFGVSAVAAPPDTASLPVMFPNSSQGDAPKSGGNTHAAVLAAHQAYGRALINNDVATRVALYRDDARSLPDQQPALYGKPQILAWYAAMQARRHVTAYEAKVREVFDSGDTLVETGGFTVSWVLANGQAETAEGKYLHVWAKDTDGSLRLKADVRNWVRPPADNRAFFVDLPGAPPPAPSETALGQELKVAMRRGRDLRYGQGLEPRL